MILKITLNLILKTVLTFTSVGLMIVNVVSKALQNKVNQLEKVEIKMTDLKLVVVKIMEKKDLEGRYGWASCFDYPEQYERMEELASEVFNELTELTNEYKAKQVYECLEAIATDISGGNYDLESIDEISFMSQDDYLEDYVLSGMDESATEMFNSLFYFMNVDSRNNWLETNYLAHDPNVYTHKMMDFIIMVRQ